MKTNLSPTISDVTLWDSLGNTCRITLHAMGGGKFEVYAHRFNDAIPTRFVGSLGECGNVIDLWLSCRKKDGFQEQAPTQTQAVIV